MEEQKNEIELVVTVRPELVDALDPHEVPNCLPGEQTTSPSDVELYFRGYLEVPKCCPDGSCANCQNGHAPAQTVVEVPTSETPAAAADAVPDETVAPPTDGASVVPQSRRSTRTSRSLQLPSAATRPVPRRTELPVTNPPSRQDAANSYDSYRSQRSEDPGLFGGVGYDDLDYKK